MGAPELEGEVVVAPLAPVVVPEAPTPVLPAGGCGAGDIAGFVVVAGEAEPAPGVMPGEAVPAGGVVPGDAVELGEPGVQGFTPAVVVELIDVLLPAGAALVGVLPAGAVAVGELVPGTAAVGSVLPLLIVPVALAGGQFSGEVLKVPALELDVPAGVAACPAIGVVVPVPGLVLGSGDVEKVPAGTAPVVGAGAVLVLRFGCCTVTGCGAVAAPPGEAVPDVPVVPVLVWAAAMPVANRAAAATTNARVRMS